MKTSKLLLSLVLSVFLTGCYSLPKFPDYSGVDSTSICGYRDPNPFNSNPIVTIDAIDGYSTYRHGCKKPFILEAGSYTLDLHLNILRSEFFSVRPILEANKNYQLKGRTEKGTFEVYLYDEESKEMKRLKKIN